MKMIELEDIFGLLGVDYIDSAKIVAFKFPDLMQFVTNIRIVIMSTQIRIKDVLPNSIILKNLSALLESFGHIDIDPFILSTYDVLIGLTTEKECGKDQYCHRDKMFVL